jgi:hypothetical protein
MTCFVCIAWAQINTVDLSPYGLKATLKSNDAYGNTPKVSVDTNYKMVEYEVSFTDDAEFTVTPLKKPMTAAMVMAEIRKASKSKPKNGAVVTTISTSATHSMFSRSRDGTTIYKFIWVTTQKGKEYMILSDDYDTADLCKQMFAIAKTFKLN